MKNIPVLLLFFFIPLFAFGAVLEPNPLVPAPKRTEKREGHWRIPPELTVQVSSAAASELPFLREAMQECHSHRILKEVERDGDVVLELLSSGSSPEAYELAIEKKGIRIAASGIRGVFYGIQTLRALLKQHPDGVLPCQKIEDEPSHEMRIISMMYERMNKRDLEDLKRNVAFCAGLKYNTVLLGIMSGFPYRNLKFDVDLDVTWEDFQDFALFCKQHHMEIIPYVQLLSHVRWLNKLPEWPHLLENPKEADSWSCTWCPNHPAVRRIWKEVLQDHIDLFQPRYFHIAMDEISQGSVGTCPRCRNTPPETLLRNELKSYVDFLSKRNVTPILWYDCFVPANATRHFRPYSVPIHGWKCLRDLPKDTLIHVWDYDLEVDRKAMDYLTKQGFHILGGAWCSKMGNIPLLSRTIHQYPEHSRGMMLCSWYYFQSKAENSSYRALAGIVTGAECFWNAGKTLEDMHYDPVREARRRLEKTPQTADAEHWRPVSMRHAMNTEWTHGFFTPKFTPEILQGLARDYASLPQKFEMASATGRDRLRCAVVSGKANGEDGFPALPVSIPLRQLRARRLAFLMSLVPTEDLALDQNELFVFDGQPLTGTLEVRRTDGSSARVELRRAENIANWNAPFSPRSGAFPVESKDADGRIIHFSVIEWTNDRPDIPLESIVLSSAFCRGRAIALYAISADTDQELSSPQAFPEKLLPDPAPRNWRDGKYMDIPLENVRKQIVSAEDLGGSVTWKILPPETRGGNHIVEATVTARKLPFGRVCFDIPVKIPSYAKAVGYTLWLDNPEPFGESSFYLLAPGKCLAHYITKLQQKEFFSDAFLNMADEGGRPDLSQVTAMRISFRLHSMNPVKIRFTVPRFYEILPVQFDWNRNLHY